MFQNRHTVYKKETIISLLLLLLYTILSILSSFLKYNHILDFIPVNFSAGVGVALLMLYGIRMIVPISVLTFLSYFAFTSLNESLDNALVYTIAFLAGSVIYKQYEQYPNIFTRTHKSVTFIISVTITALMVQVGNVALSLLYSSKFYFDNSNYLNFLSDMVGMMLGASMVLSMVFHFSKEKIRFDLKIISPLVFSLVLGIFFYLPDFSLYLKTYHLEYLFLIPPLFLILRFKPIVLTSVLFINTVVTTSWAVKEGNPDILMQIELFNTLFCAVFLIALSIAPRKKKESKEFIDIKKLQDMIDIIPSPIFFKDEKRNYIGSNKAFDLFTGHNRRKSLTQLIKYSQNSIQKEYEISIVADNDKEKYIIVYISELYNENGKKIGVLGIVFDISEQIEAKKTLQIWKDRYKMALDGANDGLWDWDLEKDEVTYSARWKKIMEYGDREIPKSIYSWLNLIVEEDKTRVVSELDRHLNGESENFQVQHRIRTTEGNYKWVEVKAKAFFNTKAKAFRMAGFTTDITELKQTEIQLKESEALFRLFMDNLPGSAFIKDESGKFVFVNEHMYKFFGYRDLIGKSLGDFLSKKLAKEKELKEKMILTQQESSTDEEKFIDQSKKIYVFKTYRFPIIQNNRKLLGGISLDITKQKDFETKLNFLAHYDTLTSLPNRILFQDRLKHAISTSKRYRKKIALMFLDLDNFKTVNDTLGHDYGDMLLIEISKRLKNSLREQDTVSRLGGDEFTVILEDIKDDTYTSVVAQKIIDTVSNPVKLKDKTVYVGASIGISIYPDDGDSMEELIKNADMAMYQAKESGRNNYKYYTEDMNIESYRKLVITNDLRNAIKNNELYVLYQPKVDIKNHKISGVEALIRWTHKELGNIPTPQFIEIAEESQVILELGEWVLREACIQARKWHTKGFRDLKIAVNFSIKQLSQYSIVDTVKKILLETKIDPSMLEIEIVENVLMENVQKVERTLKSLRKFGITVAIDDFGTGYSSLSYLKKLPIHTLKIDKSFVQDVPRKKDDMQIVSTIISMGRQLGLEVIAEGVETKEQVEFLKSQKCFLMQGYYFSEPVAAKEFEEILEKYNTTFAITDNEIKRVVT